MKLIFISMLGFIMMVVSSMAGHPLDPQLVPKYSEKPNEPVKPVDYQENTGN
jgi:hypothetical protein